MRRLALGALIGSAVFACGSFGNGDEPGPLAGTDAGAGAGTGSTGNDASIPDGATATCDPSLVATDPRNCGACGHDCLGGTCVAATCQPLQIASFVANEAIGVAASDTTVGWAYKDGASKAAWAPKNDLAKALPRVLSADLQSITASPDALYVSAEGGGSARIWRIGSDNAQVEIVNGSSQNVHYPYALAPSPRGITFLDYYDDFTAAGVYLLPLGAPPRDITKLAPLDGATASGSLHRWDHIVNVGGRVFLSEYAGISVIAGTQATEPSPFCTTDCSHGVIGLATDGQSVFWTNDGPTGISRCAAGDTCGGAVLFTMGALVPRHLAHDGRRLFFTTDPFEGQAHLQACSDCSDLPNPIANEPWFPTPPFVTGDAIYWLAGDTPPAPGGGSPSAQTFRVMRVAK